MENQSTNDEGILHNRSENRAENSRVTESRPSAFGGSSENEDIALAKILQEQERAFLSLSGGTRTMENVPPFAVGQGMGSYSGEQEQVDPESMTDEQLAWKLMQEEEQALQQRMMAMAGLVPGTSREGAGVEDAEHPAAYDDDEEEEEEEEEDAIDPDDLTYEELTVLGEVAGTVAAGLTEKQLNALNRTQYKEFTRENNHSDPCVVCQLEFEAEDSVIVLPCKHVYHPECIVEWLKQKKKCPHCGQEMAAAS